MEAEPEVTTMGERGQVVIPKSLRDQLGVTPRTKFIVFGQGDYIVLKKLELPDARLEWERLVADIDRKGTSFPEADVEAEVAAVRDARRKRSPG